MKNEEVQKEKVNMIKKLNKTLKKFFIKKSNLIVVIAIVSILGLVGYRQNLLFTNKTTKLGFEDIGELATQAAYCTEVHVTDKSKDLYGIKIPFTQSKYIYSYDIVIKAGFDFSDIEWEENNKNIIVKLPEAKILSNDINLDTFKIYHEAESIFTPINLKENNEAQKSLKEQSEKDAIANGLLKNARANVETILIGFFGKEYDLGNYKIIFKDK